ncbi:MAG: acyl carrier protein [Clostridiales bacterium]|nr:acyl carrier protein [Clostridiales bacterium]
MKVHPTVARLMAEILSADGSEMTPNFPLGPGSGIDPIDVAKLAIACEETFGFALFDEKVAQWRVLGDASRQIEELTEEGQGQATEKTEEERAAWFYE